MSQATPTLDAGPTNATRRGYLAETWLRHFRKECAAADRLWQLAHKRKDGPDRDALLTGYFAVLQVLERTVECATQVGGLPLLWDGSAAMKGGAA